MSQIKTILKEVATRIQKVTDIPKKEALSLLSFDLGVDITWLIANDDRDIKPSKEFYKNVEKREEFYPLEYILKKVEFYSMSFYVDERVLIPRPETEILVDIVISTCKDIDNPTIAEIGTGSGIISVTLSKILKNSKIIATDISNKALEVAKINAKKHEVADEIEFVYTNLLDGIEDNIDIIVSNPPYIKRGEELEKNLSFEPDLALFGGEEGDEILKDIIDLAFKKDVKYLFCEMGYDQKEKIKNYCKKFDKDVEFYKDLAGFDRGFILKL